MMFTTTIFVVICLTLHHHEYILVNAGGTSPPEINLTPCGNSYSNNCTGSACEYKVSWDYDSGTDEIIFTFETSANLDNNWIGIGFAEDKLQTDYDVYYGWYNSGNDILHFQDSKVSNSTLLIDDSQDAGIDRAAINGSITTLQFTRSRNTSDANDAQFTDSSTTGCFYFIYTWGGTVDPVALTGATTEVSDFKICVTDCSCARSAGASLTVTFTEAAAGEGFTGDEYKRELGYTSYGVALTFASIAGDLDPVPYFELVYGTFGGITGYFIKQKAAIDRDVSPPPHHFRVLCDRRSIVPIKLLITDINDNSPVFNPISYNNTNTIYETSNIGTILLVGVTATDIDAGMNADIKYSIVPGDGSVSDGSSLMSIDADSGQITLMSHLDLEPLHAATNASMYVITVRATDQAAVSANRLTSDATFTLTITDVNDLPPAFIWTGCHKVSLDCFNPEYKTSVAAGPPSTDFLVIRTVNSDPQAIVAQDRDVNKQGLTFVIEETIPTGYISYFSLDVISLADDKWQLKLKTITPFDRNTVQQFRAVIKVTEVNGGRYNRAVLDVTVTSINQNNPVMTSTTGSFTGYIWEDVDTNDFVKNQAQDQLMKILVTDADVLSTDPPASYTFTTVPSDVFEVDVAGYVRLVRASGLDYETDQVHTIKVTVTEVGTTELKSSTTDIVINVLDINDNRPMITSRYHVLTILEGDYTSTGFSLVDLEYTDADSGVNAQVEYLMDQVIPKQPSKFSVDANGVVMAVGVMVLEETYSINVRVKDKGDDPRYDVAIIGLTVISSGNKAPVIPETEYSISVCEGVPVGSSLFTVPATDYEMATLTFSITDGDSTSTFTIDANGVLKTAKKLDRETMSSYTLNIKVSDPSTDITQVMVTVTDINDNTPQFDQSRYNFNVAEKTIVSVGTVSATDDDEANTLNSQLMYSIYDEQNMFVITANGGVISTRVQLDWEVHQQHTFLVLATDKATDNRRGSAIVTIDVMDVQDSIPIFNTVNYIITFPEGTTDSVFLTVMAVDADAVKNIVYEFDGGEHDKFDIDSSTGEIKIVTALDYSVKQSYIFTVTTTDGKAVSIPSATATVTVRVEGQNGCIGSVEDETPVFSYPTCPTTTGGHCINPEYTSTMKSENLGVLEVFPHPINTPSTAVSIKAKDPDTTNNAITFSILQTIPTEYKSYFTVTTTAPAAGADGMYTASVNVVKKLNTNNVKSVRIILLATETSTNKLQSSASISVTIEKGVTLFGGSHSTTITPSIVLTAVLLAWLYALHN